MDLTVEERLVESGFHLFRGRYEKALPTYDFIIDHVWIPLFLGIIFGEVSLFNNKILTLELRGSLGKMMVLRFELTSPEQNV